MSTNGLNWSERYSSVKGSNPQEYVKKYMIEYRKVKEIIMSEKDKFNFEDKPALAKETIAIQRANELEIKDDFVKNLYVTTLLLPDDEEFLRVYNECDENTSLCAEKLNVPVSVVKSKVFAIKTFGVVSIDKEIEDDVIEPKALEIDQILSEEEKRNETIEQINEVNDSVEKSTVAALAKINSLLNGNEAKEATINRQATAIEGLNGRINSLEDEVREKNQVIKTKEEIIAEKEKEILELSKQVADLKKEIGPLREFYQRVMFSLGHNQTNQVENSQDKNIR